MQGWVRGGSKEDARGMARQKELLTQQERELAHLRAQLASMQVCLASQSSASPAYADSCMFADSCPLQRLAWGCPTYQLLAHHVADKVQCVVGSQAFSWCHCSWGHAVHRSALAVFH